jgi:rhodanese-related sulfurtransferase
MKPVYLYIIIFCFISFVTGCLKDEPRINESVEIDQTAAMLSYVEIPGEVLFSDPPTVLISADSLYKNLDSFTVFDFRNADDFSKGHIEGAINVSGAELLSKIEENNVNKLSRIACVDADGQSSAYFTGLLRLCGYRNVYSLNFGMAMWNKDFSDIWLKVISQNRWSELKFTDNIYLMNSFSPLPSTSFPVELKTSESKFSYKISELLKRGFIDTLRDINDTLYKKYYIVCAGDKSLYICGSRSAFPDKGHPNYAVNYAPARDFYSAYNLQTLPSGKPILLYCYNGQLSALLTAYLRTLGYDASMLLYGGEFLFHERMGETWILARSSFSPDLIRNYNYVK